MHVRGFGFGLCVPVPQVAKTANVSTQALFLACQEWTNLLLGFWAMISGMEWLRTSPLLADKRLLDWNIAGSRPGLIGLPYVNSLVSSTPLFIFLNVLRILSGILLSAYPTTIWALAPLVIVIIASSFTGLRCFFGADGSDQMGIIVAIGASIITLGNYRNDGLMRMAGLCLIVGQLVLSYFIAGLAKIISVHWRNGSALRGVMRTESYGSEVLFRFLDNHKIVAVMMSWFVIAIELAAPLILVLPIEATICLLVLLGVFHVWTAVIMGLNTFAFAFPAAFPSAVVARLLIGA